MVSESKPFATPHFLVARGKLQALKFYQKHLELTGSTEGRFVACLNMYVAYSTIGDEEKRLAYQEYVSCWLRLNEDSHESRYHR